MLAFGLNVIIALLGTLLLRALKVPGGVDQTRLPDYTADSGDADVIEELTPTTAAH